MATAAITGTVGDGATEAEIVAGAGTIIITLTGDTWIAPSFTGTFWAPFTDPADPLHLNAGTGSLTFTRASTATYVHPSTGLITSAAVDQLRIESNGALIEGERTNIALQSEVLGTTWAASNITVANNSAVSPDGNTTADTLTASAANGTLLQTITGTAADYTFSVYLKRLTGTGNVDITADGTTYATQTINSSTWTRCQVTATLTAASYTPGIRIVTNTDAVYAWGGQMELGAFASSYIPTTTGAVVRNADNLTFPTSSNIDANYGTASGTVTPNGSGGYRWMMTNPGGGNYVLWYYTGSISQFYAVKSGTPESANAAFAHTVGTPYKMASSWSLSGTVGKAICVNGGTVTRDITEVTELQLDTTIGPDSAYTPSSFNIKNLKIWSTAFTDAELQAETT